jgi:hypothetical protein
MQTVVTIAHAFCGRTLAPRLFFGGLLLLLIIGTRWAWIDCDGGTPSLTEYGYFQTDEGFYSSGGKQKLLFGRLINVTRASPCTYAICPSTHVMTWAAFRIFGQTTWAHRVFPLLISTLAWLCLFHFLSRKTLAWIAFLLCAVCLLNPLMTVYGRTACSDSLMASVVLLGYIMARRKGLLFPFLGGFVFGLGLWVKQSIWVLFPLGLAGAAMTASAKGRWSRLACCALGFLVSVFIQYGLIRLLIHGDALSQNVTVDQLMKISNSSYSLPNPFDWVSTFKGVSSFPRFPTGGLLGVFIPLFLVLPALLLLRRLTDSPFRWDGRLLLYLTLPLYATGIMILPVYYAHYFIPVIAFIPILWLEARRDLKLWVGRERWLAFALMALAVICVMVSFHSFEVTADKADCLNAYLANAYNLPQQIVWAGNGVYVLVTAALLTLLGVWARPRKPTGWVVAIGVLFSALGVADLCYCRLHLSEAYKYTPIFPATVTDVAHLLQVVAIAFFFVIWCLPGMFRQSVRWYLFLLVIFVCGTLANPRWRKGVCELAERGYLHKQAVAKLASIVPDNAVVFGERAPQLFLSLKSRVSPMPNGDPVPVVLAVHEKFPDRPLFALLDSEHNYHYAHYTNCSNRIRVEVLNTLKLPSFNNGLPANVYLLRLHVLTNQIKYGPLVR